MAAQHAFMLDRLEHACDQSILAARQGKLSAKRALRLVNGELVRRSAPNLPEAHVEKGVAMCRHIFTRRATWALFTVDWMDSLARLVASLVPGVASPRVLEVCAGLNTLAAPFRARGIDWLSSDVRMEAAA
eukprot:5898157-Prymnesium_polylepis.1